MGDQNHHNPTELEERSQTPFPSIQIITKPNPNTSLLHKQGEKNTSKPADKSKRRIIQQSYKAGISTTIRNPAGVIIASAEC